MTFTHYSAHLKIILFLVFGLLLSYFNFSVSTIVSISQTELFFDHVLEYFKEYNKHTIKGELMTGVIDELEDFREHFSKSKNVNGLYLLLIIPISALFFIMYRTSKWVTEPDNHKPYFRLQSELKYPLFISLFFSVGLAFYFSTTLVESSMIETTSTILSTVQPFTDTRVPLDDESVKTIMAETVGTKMSLISLLFADKTTEFLNSSYSQTYFFFIVGFLILGILLNTWGKPFFADAFFISSLVGAMFWILHTALKLFQIF